MTEVVKVTSKGQITLPISIRKAIGISDDSYLLVEQIGDYVLMKKADYNTHGDRLWWNILDAERRESWTPEETV